MIAAGALRRSVMVLAAAIWAGTASAQDLQIVNCGPSLGGTIDRQGRLDVIREGVAYLAGGRIVVVQSTGRPVPESEYSSPPKSPLGGGFICPGAATGAVVVERVAKKDASKIMLQQVVRSVGSRLLVDCSCAAENLAGSYALLAFDLPGHLAGKSILFGEREIAIPQTSQGEPVLARGDVAALEIGTLPKKIYIRPIGMREVILEDRRNEGESLRLIFRMGDLSGTSIRGPRTASLLVAQDDIPRPPLLVLEDASPAEVPLYEKFEISFRLWGDIANPFDPQEADLGASFTSPSGKALAIPGFLYQGFERRLADAEGAANGEKRELLDPVGGALWKIRFSPAEEGRHEFTVRLSCRGEEAARYSGALMAVPSGNPGFVKASERDSRYLDFTGGKSFFAIGENLAWPGPRGTFAYEDYFGKLAPAGANSARVWLCTWGLHIEGRRLDDYDLGDAWRIDRVFEEAHKRGIYLTLCLDNFWDLVKNRNKLPYFKECGGPAGGTAEFFTDTACRKAYARRLRYCAARWGYSPNLMCWEILNEMDYAVDPSTAEAAAAARGGYLVPWVKEMTARLAESDAYKHVITNSLSQNTVWPEMWRLETIGMVKIHAYINVPATAGPSPADDEVGLLLARTELVRGFGKPALVGEFGFAGSGASSPLNDVDPEGLHLHNAIWASGLSGAAGTAHPWWWDNYVDKNDLYRHFRSFANFVKGVDFAGERFGSISAPEEGAVRVVGLKSENLVLAWIQNRESTWSRRLVKKLAPSLLADIRIKLANMGPGGVWRVEWWDTYEGGMRTWGERSADAEGVLSLALPEFAGDTALKVIRVQRKSQ